VHRDSEERLLNTTNKKDVPVYANYALVVDPRSNIQHIFNNLLVYVFQSLLFFEFKLMIPDYFEKYLSLSFILSKVILYFQQYIFFNKNNFINFFQTKFMYIHTDLRTLYLKTLAKQNMGFILLFFMLNPDSRLCNFHEQDIQ